MSIDTRKYIRKPLYVDAVRVTGANFEEIAVWCQGEIQRDEVVNQGFSGKRYIKVRVQNPKNPRQSKAFVGDWILYTDRGYKVYTTKAFHAAFDLVEPDPPAEAEDEEVSAAQTQEWDARADDPVNVKAHVDTQLREGLAEQVGPPKYPDPVIVPATSENIAEAILDNEEARAELDIPSAQEKIAAEDKRVLSLEEQQKMSPEELRELILEGDVVLAQDIVHP